jgi:hypothetical protein
VQFSITALTDSLLDGIILGGLLAIILVTIRGPLVAVPEQPGQPTKRRRKSRKLKQPSVADTQRRAKLSDYLLAWVMLAVIVASASYAVAGGHGAYGIVTSSVRAMQAVREPGRLVLMAVLNTLVFGGMGAVLWTGIWWIGMLLLRLLGPKWVERTMLIHGTAFGLVIGGLLGLSVTLNEGMAGNIVSPMDLLF